MTTCINTVGKGAMFLFSIGSILNLLGLFDQTKCFFMVRQIKVKYFCGKTVFGGLFRPLRGFFVGFWVFSSAQNFLGIFVMQLPETLTKMTF